MKSPTILIPDFTDVTYEDLLEVIDFQQRSVTVYGKSYPQPRLTCWYGPIPYTYSNLTWEARELPPLIKELQLKIEELTGKEFPTVLANLYRDGSDKISWHSDDEPLFGYDPCIASLSFGAERDFFLRHKADNSIKEQFLLTDKSLLIMNEGTQSNWEHALPARKRVQEPRINLTFRPLMESR